MTGAESVRAVLLEHDVLSESDSWRFACDQLVRAAPDGVDEVCRWLDLLRLAVEHDPATRVVAADIITRLEETTK